MAVSVPETIGVRMDETNIVSERDIALCCSSLIRKSAQDEYFEFAHFSVKEFLQDDMLLQTPELGAYRLVESESKALIALQCLRFLQVGNIDDNYVASCLADDDSAESIGFSSFFFSACRDWLDLTRGGLDDPSLLDAAKSLFHHSATLNFRLWIYVLFREILSWDLDDSRWHDVEPRIRELAFSGSMPPLHVASALNIPELCSSLIQAGARVDADSPLGTPLLLAEVSFLGFMNDLLGEYPNRESLYFEEILPTSSRRNDTIDCLISSGASFQSLKGLTNNESMLMMVAIICCHLEDFETFITLLDHGHIPTADDTTAFGDYLKTWPKNEDSNLEEAVLGLLHYLMKSSSYRFDWGFDLGNKVWLAAVTLGFSFTSDTTLTDSRISLSVAALVDKTLLAIENDDTAMLQLCMKDNRIRIIGIFDRTLLHHAVAADALECARFFLELGSDPEAITSTGVPVLHCCNMKGDGTVLKLLVEYGLSLLAQSLDSGTLWHLCASSDECQVSFLEALLSIDSECNQKALLIQTEAGFTPPMLALMALEDASEDDVERLESKALLFLHYCQGIPDFWYQHESLFTLASRAGSKKVFQLLLQLDPGFGVIKPGDATPFHSLGVNPTQEWLEFLTTTFPEALQLRFEDQLPLESYIKRTLQASETPQSDVIQALSSPDIFTLKNKEGATPWKVVCNIKEEAEDWENLEQFLSSGWVDLDSTFADLLGFKAMEAYETETGQCGVYPLLACSWVTGGCWTVFSATLEQAIQSSSLWDPTQDVVVGYLKSMIRIMDTSSVQLLTKYGADVHQRENGTSPIESACEPEAARNLCSEDKGIAILQCLLDHSRPERIRDFSTDNRAFSILHRLAMESPPKLIEWLLRQLVEKGAVLDAINPMASPQYRVSPLTWHLIQKSILCADVLLELGADPLLAAGDVSNSADAFMAAVGAGSLTFLEKLHSLSANKPIAIRWKRRMNYSLERKMMKILGRPYIRNANLCHFACVKENFGVVEFLLQRQLVEDTDSRCGGGFTALHFAAMLNQATIIETLVSHKASVNLQSDDGRTALHFAARAGNIEASRVLLQLGALNLVDKRGRTAGMLASAEGHGNIAAILDRHFRSTAEANNLDPESVSFLVPHLGVAIEQGDLDECQRLFAGGCPIDKPVPGRKPTYPLLYALHCEKAEIVQWLLDNGASVLVNDGDSSPPGENTTVVEEVGRNTESLPLIPTILDRYLNQGGCWLHGFEFPLHLAALWDRAEGLRLMLNHVAEHAVAIG